LTPLAETCNIIISINPFTRDVNESFKIVVFSRTVEEINKRTHLEDCKKQRYVVHFLWAKGFSAKDIHKEMFLVHN
jgi:hypothetical protein